MRGSGNLGKRSRDEKEEQKSCSADGGGPFIHGFNRHPATQNRAMGKEKKMKAEEKVGRRFGYEGRAFSLSGSK